MSAATPPPTVEQRQEFLLRAARRLHQHGTPSHRLERVMQRVSHTLDVRAEFLYTPTALLVSFAEGPHRTTLLRIEPDDVDLGKLFEFDEALEALEDGRATLAETDARFEQIACAPPRHGLARLLVAAGVASGASTVFLGGGLLECLFAAGFGAWTVVWSRLLRRWSPRENLLELTAAFTAAALALVAARFAPLDYRLATLGSVIVLVPGLGFTVAMTELANRHWSSGVARLAGASVVLLALGLGVAIAWRLGVEWRPPPVNVERLPDYVRYLALIVAPFAFLVLFQARLGEWNFLCPVAWLGFLAADLATGWRGAEFGAFAGALTLGALSNLYARLRDRPSLVAQMPAMLLLVPGSLGYRSLTAFLDRDGLRGVELAFAMTLVAISLVGGLLTANLIVPTKRIL